MNIKLGIVVPYFGRLPAAFGYWLDSAIANPEVNFHIITDQVVSGELGSNIIVHEMTFEAIQDRIKAKLGGRKISTPYKLCDLKPTYGYLFEDILASYDYWAYSDIDLIYGDISKFVETDEIFGLYDKIMDRGHLSFYRNVECINQIFKNSSANYSRWPYIRDSDIIWVFDENYYRSLGGINGNLLDQGYSLFSGREWFADVDPKYVGFFDINNGSRDNCFFKIDGRKLYCISIIDNAVNSRELIYAHFQKRFFSVIDVSKTTRIIIPEHWPQCSSENDALNVLRKNDNLDGDSNENFYLWVKARKLQKLKMLAREFLSSPKAAICILGHFLNKSDR